MADAALANTGAAPATPSLFDERQSVAVEIARFGLLDVGENMGRNCRGGNCCLGSDKSPLDRFPLEKAVHRHDAAALPVHIPECQQIPLPPD